MPNPTKDALIESFELERATDTNGASYLRLWERLSRTTMLDEEAAASGRTEQRRGKGLQLTLIACFRDFQVSKYLKSSSSEQEGEEVSINDHDVSLDLLTLTPLHLFTKTQKVNLSNRLLQVLVDSAFFCLSI